MSASNETPTDGDVPTDDRLETLYELREELRLVADSDCAYAEYAQNGLDALQEAGYDV